jgi:phosphatidylglycerol:prolipoprotein diacylglycerol transferase
MHPVLVDLGIVKIYSYGFMLALSFLLGILIASRRARGRGVEPEVIYDLSIVLVLGAVIGSRGLYIITHSENYHSIIDVVALWQGGATYYGGLILAVAGAVVYVRRKGIPFFRVADICAPSIAAGVFITRIGCFLSGCCFGNPTQCPTGVVFPPGSPAGHYHPATAIHPTQLYSSLYGLAIFAILMLIDRKKRFDGFLFAWFCILYGAARFTVDFFRFYEDSAIVAWGLTDNQVISILLVVFGAVFLARGAAGRGRRT